MRFDVDPKVSTMVGRNGEFNITGMLLNQGTKLEDIEGRPRPREVQMVFVDGVGKRNKVITGGFFVDMGSFVKGVIAFLEEQGYTVTKRSTK